MSSAIVLDASVALTWCFMDEASTYGDNVLEAIRDRDVYVPDIWPVEISNAILKGERRKRIGVAEAERFVELLESLSVIVDRPSNSGVKRLLPLGRAQQISSYDAAYLDLAMREGISLATLDSPLSKAARRVGVPLFEVP